MPPPPCGRSRPPASRTDGHSERLEQPAREVRALTGFDRVMVYRFDQDGAGEVIAESARSGIDSYLGQRYPASDIPRQARQLYERNWLRIIADVNAEPSPIEPPLDRQGRPLDLSMSTLRSVSAIHIEYLQNMGVQASMSVSILREGRLWGLFACHHYAPHRVNFGRRTAAELFGQMFSLLMENRERKAESEYEGRGQTLHQRLITMMAGEGLQFESIVAPGDIAAFCVRWRCALHERSRDPARPNPQRGAAVRTRPAPQKQRDH
jgi:light-regulated signal transduction histidine kinase (bacteriophytochrome)